MSIVASDIKYFQSANTGSTGGVISTNQIVDSVLNNLFPDVTGDEAAAGKTDYRKAFVKNSHSTLTLMNPKIWILREPQSEDDIEIALGDANDSNPTTLTFFKPLDKAQSLLFSDLAPGESQGFWIKRITPKGAKAFPAASSQVVVEGDTL